MTDAQRNLKDMIETNYLQLLIDLDNETGRMEIYAIEKEIARMESRSHISKVK